MLFERLGGLGVHSFEELRLFTGQVTPQQRKKRHLADAMPHLPGVYLFRDQRGRVLYVGKSKDLKTRVRSYFTSSEMRQRMTEMVAIAHDVVPIVCATELEAQVRELLAAPRDVGGATDDRQLSVLVDLLPGLLVAGHEARHHECLGLRSRDREAALDEQDVQPLLHAGSIPHVPAKVSPG